jgi:hypothetical protein
MFLNLGPYNSALDRRSLSMTSGGALPATSAQPRTHATSLIVIWFACNLYACVSMILEASPCSYNR